MVWVTSYLSKAIFSMQTIIQTFGADTLRIVGVGGFILYVGNYLMLTFGLKTSESVAYFAINLLASAMVLMGLTVEFNLSSSLIQVFYLSISLCGVVIRLPAVLRDRRQCVVLTQSSVHLAGVSLETGSQDRGYA